MSRKPRNEFTSVEQIRKIKHFPIVPSNQLYFTKEEPEYFENTNTAVMSCDDYGQIKIWVLDAGLNLESVTVLRESG